jgi:hypothetical protein
VSQGLLWQALTDCGCTVFRRADKFDDAGVSDPEWLEVAGREKWIVITKDQAIARRPNELMALQNAGVRAFVLAAGEMTGPEQVVLFVKLLPVMKRYVRKLRGAFVVRANRDRTTEVLHRSRARRWNE